MEYSNIIMLFRKLFLYEDLKNEAIIDKEPSYTLFVFRDFKQLWFFRNCMFQDYHFIYKWMESSDGDSIPIRLSSSSAHSVDQ